MTTDEELRTVAEAVESSLSVVGCGPGATASLQQTVDGTRSASTGSEGEAADRQATLVAVDLGDAAFSAARDGDGSPSGAGTETATGLEATVQELDGFTILVASVPAQFGVAERDALDRLREVADAVVLVRDGWLGDAVRELRALIEDAGVVNLDLADVRTLLAPGSLGVFTGGTGSTSAPESAVTAAVDGLVSGVDPATGDGALIDVVGTADLSVDGAASLVDRVRAHVGEESHVIWGTDVADVAAETSTPDRSGSGPADVRLRLLVAGIDPPEPTRTPGDRCPRCDGTLSGYTMGDSTTIACDDCGYAGVSRR